MTTVVLVAFLVLHGLLHLVIWVPKPEVGRQEAPPFEPDHSAVLSRAVPQTAVRQLSLLLAGGAAATYVLAGIGVALGAVWTVPAAVVAAGLGMVLKGLYFNPWLSVGVLLDLGVLLAAVAEWPVALS